MTQPLPHWDLSNVFPGLDSEPFRAAVADVAGRIQRLDALLLQRTPGVAAETPPADLAPLLAAIVDQFNALLERSSTVGAYIRSFTTTNSRDTEARKRLSEFEQVTLGLDTLGTRLQAWVGTLGDALEQAIPLEPTLAAHAFALREIAEQAQYLMSQPEEALAAELNLSGANAWGKLQGTVVSQLSVPFELDGQTQNLPMPALINLRSHPDESVRRRGYEAEMQAWESVREPLAAAMNGIKGSTVTLNQRRGREDALHSALDLARIDRTTLQAMLDAMEGSFPTFRRYFQAKARRLGKDKLPWWDLFAPTGRSDRTYSWDEARTFVLEHFATFSPELAAFAAHAFDRNWIDAEPRTGKVGGAFCMGLPAAKESRILANFDGSLDQVSTLAHELGHAFHNDCLDKANKTELQQRTPMTLAETASILCETIVMQAALAKADDPQERLGILETMLIGDAQVIVDIYARYLFESEVFRRRAQAELSADDLCALMEQAQRATYGDGLDERYLQRYMWTWKPHYYSARLSFYNFPYAFGLLFGTGLYAIYKQRGADFVPDYTALLAATGEGNAAELAARFGIDIRTRRFWDDSLGVIAQRVEEYCAL